MMQVASRTAEWLRYRMGLAGIVTDPAGPVLIVALATGEVRAIEVPVFARVIRHVARLNDHFREWLAKVVFHVAPSFDLSHRWPIPSFDAVPLQRVQEHPSTGDAQWHSDFRSDGT